jgi:hypothetical protein
MACSTHGIAETILADANPGMKKHPISDRAARQRDTGSDGAILAYEDLRSQNRIGTNRRALPDNHTLPDHHPGIEHNAPSDAGAGVHETSPWYACTAENRPGLEFFRMQPGKKLGVGPTGIWNDQGNGMGWHQVSETLQDEAGPCPGALQLRRVAGMVHVNQIRRIGHLKACSTPQPYAGVERRRKGRPNLSDEISQGEASRFTQLHCGRPRCASQPNASG